ncbi:MAG TPA: choice-of-anchor tandem repeat GloVer-containing protein [Verrucomicrobiae bacterium]|nr:choice-of-anchor tandem repeat GloVer-containing protein [Verrucomicrobiae bacterium]
MNAFTPDGRLPQPASLISGRAATRLLLFVLVAAAQSFARAQGFQELHAFTGPPDGSLPKGALIQATDGNFYGTTFWGGTNTQNGQRPWGLGTVFKMTSDGQLTTMASFNGTNGMYPAGALLQGADGNFYGITTSDINGNPTLFVMGPDGALYTLARFDGAADPNPLGGLAQGPDGNLYGVTERGGLLSEGTVFRMVIATSPWELQTLVTFSLNDHPELGAYPEGGMVLGNDGSLYGTTGDGGACGAYGTVFKMTTNGDLTTLAPFCRSPGSAVWPGGRLLLAADGSFYGTAGGGTYTFGCVFHFTPGDAPAVLGSLTVDCGSDPVDGLAQANDSNIYGVATSAGQGNCGAVFRITPDGTASGLLAFSGQAGPYPGCNPYAGLVRGRDGNLYGTCGLGSAGSGNVFRIIIPGPPLSVAAFGAGQIVLSWPTNYQGYTLQSSPRLEPPAWSPCTNVPVIGSHQYYVTNSIIGSAAFFRLQK